MSATLYPHPPGQPAVLAPIGSAFSVTLGKMLDAGRAVDDLHATLPYIRAANIQDEGLRLTDVNEMPFSAAEARRLDLREGDLLVVEGGAVGTCVVLDRDMPGWSFQKTVNRLRPTNDWSTRYLAYVLRSYRDAGIIDLICNGSTIAHLTAEKLRALRVPVVQPETQRAIAEFLDRETAQIDALVAKQDEFIALLQERRASRTADILADLGMPDTQLRRVARIQTGITLSGREDPSLPSWPYLRVANVQMGHVDLSEIKTIHLSEHDASSSILRAGDVLMTEGGDIDKLGRGTVWDGLIAPMLHQNHVFAARPKSGILLPEYLALWLDSPTAREYFYLTAKKTTNLASTNKTIVGRLPIRVPSIEQQKSAIQRHLQEVGRIDALITKAQEHVTFAKERRAALITAAITGQIDVCTTRKAG